MGSKTFQQDASFTASEISGGRETASPPGECLCICKLQAAMAIVKKDANGKVSGTKFLKATQTYPRKFCRRAAELHRQHLQARCHIK